MREYIRRDVCGTQEQRSGREPREVADMDSVSDTRKEFERVTGRCHGGRA